MALTYDLMADWDAMVAGRLAGMPERLTRAEYDVWCARTGVAPEADRRLGWYRAGEFQYDNDPEGAFATRQRVHLARLRGIEAESTPAPPAVMIPCPNCGALTPPSSLMSASRGTACPECYDAMSEA